MSTNALARPGRLFPSLFDDFFKPWNEWFDTSSALGRAITVPAVNITENVNDYNISVAAPGLKKNDFHINVDGNMLTISAEKEETKEEKEGENYTRKEYNYSSFSRSFTLPQEVNREKIEASYEDGVLKLVLPKKEEVKKAVASKQIEVK
jgi:HSP20 family protein